MQDIGGNGRSSEVELVPNKISRHYPAIFTKLFPGNDHETFRFQRFKSLYLNVCLIDTYFRDIEIKKPMVAGLGTLLYNRLIRLPISNKLFKYIVKSLFLKKI